MRRLVLLGGGHAHVHVLAALAQRPLPGWDVQLVTPHRRQIYSGMLPGWIAGHYGIEACAIALDELALRAGVGFRESVGTGVDLEHRSLHCAGGAPAHFDVLSIDTGPVAAVDRLPGSGEHALQLRPIEAFIAQWPRLVDTMLARCRRFDLAILGAGAAGLEVAFAIQRRAQADGWSHLRLALVGSAELPLEGAPMLARRRAPELLRSRGIGWHGDRRATQVAYGTIHFERHPPLRFDACLAATGAAAPGWPALSGLATDEQGFTRVGRTLQSISHPHVFAAGDVAAYHDRRPKSGVFAVRAGPALAANLRAFCDGAAPRPWRPQARALYLISTGDRHALATWGGLVSAGRWAGRWKDWIDRRFMRRFGTAS